MQLMSHQIEALDFLADKTAAGLFYEMGLGKTLVLLEHIKRKEEEKDFSHIPVLIVCPLSAVSVWSQEVKKFGYGFQVTELTGSTKERITLLKGESDIFITNYEGLRLIGECLKQKGFKAIILDEAHRIKERKSQQTNIALQLALTIPNRYILTGTPVTKSPEDIWAQIQFLSFGHLGNFFAFRNRYVDTRTLRVRAPGGIREIQKAVKFKNLKELESRISSLCLRRTKKECLDLPEKIYKTIHCELNEEQKKHYYSLKHSLATILEDRQFNIMSAATLIQKLQQVCQGFLYDEAGTTHHFKNNGKAKVLEDLLQDIGHEKIILFAWFKADIDCLAALLRDKGYTFFRYDGNLQERREAVERFQTSSGPAIFLSQIERGKESITITAAQHVIYYGNSWNYGSRKQSEDRAHRTGQTKNVIYYDLVVPRSVDELVINALKRKEDLADRVTGDTARIARMICEEEVA